MAVMIRFAQPSDMAQIIDLCAAHAEFERSEYDRNGKVEKLSRDLFKDNPGLFCLVIEQGEDLLGYATFMKQYATWDAAEYIYMDCLFIKEEARSKGLGEKLVRQIQLEGIVMGCSLIQWQTPDFNTRAMKFYKRIGATSKSKERFFLQTTH